MDSLWFHFGVDISALLLRGSYRVHSSIICRSFITETVRRQIFSVDLYENQSIVFCNAARHILCEKQGKINEAYKKLQDGWLGNGDKVPPAEFAKVSIFQLRLIFSTLTYYYFISRSSWEILNPYEHASNLVSPVILGVVGLISLVRKSVKIFLLIFSIVCISHSGPSDFLSDRLNNPDWIFLVLNWSFWLIALISNIRISINQLIKTTYSLS